MDPRSNYMRKPPTPPASSPQPRSSLSPVPPPLRAPSDSDQLASHPQSSTPTAYSASHPTARHRLPPPSLLYSVHAEPDYSRRSSHASEGTPVSSAAKTSPFNPYQSFNPRSDSLGYMNSEKHWPAAPYPYSQYPLQIPDRPLIDRVTNQWQNDPKYKDLYHGDYEEDEDYAQFMSESDDAHSVCSWPRRLPRRAQRYIFLYCTFLLCCFSLWHFWFRPAMDQEEDLDRSMIQSNRAGSFGINVRPEFAGLLQVQYLDSKRVPGATHGSPKRLIAVGDVHGCKEEREYSSFPRIAAL